MRCIARVAGCVVLALLTAGPAAAAPYWVAWEGNDYPENEGWERFATITQPTRNLSNGIMTLDSLASTESEDLYAIDGMPDPEPGEEFVVQWRLRVNQVDWDNPSFPYDPGWSVNSGDGWAAGFAIGINELHSFFEQNDVAFESGAFHSWEFRSANMRTFTVYLDGSRVLTGSFVRTLPGARVIWGDAVQSPTSNVNWDYFRVGVVPEPVTAGWFVIILTSLWRKS